MKICILILLIFATSCGPQGGPHRQLAKRNIAPADQTDYTTVKPIFAQYCAGCHPSRSSPDWLNYNQAKTFADNGILNQRVLVEKSMPPPSSSEAASISQDDRNAIGNWIKAGAKQTITAGPIIATATTAATEANSLAQTCLNCHGVSGPQNSVQKYIPRLGGQNTAYLIRQLQDYKWLKRVDPSYDMNRIAVGLSESDIRSLARYFSATNSMQQFKVQLQREEAQSFALGQSIAVNSCNSCHMNSANNNRPLSEQVPVLNGQNQQYIMNQLLYFKKGWRNNAVMNELTKNLRDEDIWALSIYYSVEKKIVSTPSTAPRASN